MQSNEPRKVESKQSPRATQQRPSIGGRKIGYIRVSDADQSEALQIDALKAAGCVKLYMDHGVSGAKKHRPGLETMLRDLSEGDTLTVWKLDRLGRSTIHLLSILDDLQQRGVHFHAITQGIDTSTAVGRMIFGQLAVFAEYERSLISERTIAGMKAAKKRGVHVGRPPMSRPLAVTLDGISKLDEVYSIAESELDRKLSDNVFASPIATAGCSDN